MKPNTSKLLERRGGLPPGKLRRVKDYMEAHLDGDITFRTMAELVHMSPYHFAHLFKQSTGLSPHQYLLHQRIRRATQLLQDARLSIMEISRRLGFRRPAHFTTAFRKVVGIAPSQYRRKQVQ